MASRFKHRLIDHLSHESYHPQGIPALARDMQVDDGDRMAFEEAVHELEHAGLLVIGPKNMISLPSMPDEVVGTFRLNARGFGFVIPEDAYREGDLYIPRGGTSDAISGDTVRALVRRTSRRHHGRHRREGTVGRVVEVVSRGASVFVGTLRRKGSQWQVVPDGRKLHSPVIVRDPSAKNARAGDKVSIELIHYPDGSTLGEGVITRVLGAAGSPSVETDAVITAHGLRREFPEEVLATASRAAQQFEKDLAGDAGKREDLTDQLVFTIDPVDARDFDDAIQVEYDGKAKEWTLGVHIADVSHFVTPGKVIDEEARARGNSVYLPRLVIPMLPEVLSNGVCSLQEGVKRFAKSVFITFDHRGHVIRQRLAATIISSRRRLHYEEAQSILDGDKESMKAYAGSSPYGEDLVTALRQAETLALLLHRRRVKDGMISLDLPESILVFDDEGKIIDVCPEDDSFTHRLIEMFMVEANEALARTFEGIEVPVLRRIHPDPGHADLGELRLAARACGHHLPASPARKDLQALLDATAGTPAARAIHFAVLRTLSKASYHPALVGHFALASDHYSHFTSPIRRYPDLVLHRALEAYLDVTGNGKNVPAMGRRGKLGRRLRDDARVLSEEELTVLGGHCSETEVEATAAERELRKLFLLQHLEEHHLGGDFDGVVTGLTTRGVFISLEKYLVEGFAAAEDFPGKGRGPGNWGMDDRSGRLVARRGGASIGAGDLVRVRIATVDCASRRLELQLLRLGSGTSTEPRPARRKKKKARR